MTPKADQKVAIAWPHPGTVPARFMRCMLDLWRYDALGARLADGTKVGGRRRILDGGAAIERSTALLVRARTDIVRDFLTLDADWLLMIDTDMTFSPDLVDRLVDAAHPTLRPIVGGLCFAFMADQSRRFWPTLFAYVPGSDALRRLTTYPEDSLVPVAATGAAAMIVHRNVLEAMETRFAGPRPWFAETETAPTPEAPQGDVLSEDITFCLRAQACGFPVLVHTGIKLGHLKSFEANEDAFLAESAMLVEARQPALPTFAVIASKERREMLATLRAQLADQVTETFVFDNGYGLIETTVVGDLEPSYISVVEGAVEAHGRPLHRMWNEGLERAAKAAAGRPHNVLILNDDVEVPNELCARLEAALRASDDHWIAYPNHRGLDLGGAPFRPTTSDTMAGQTMSGWCFMVRGEAGLRLDERFAWWYGDSDLERTVREAGKRTVCVDVEARHLDPMRSTMEDPERLTQALADEEAFALKWGLDPSTLWLFQQNLAWPSMAVAE